MMATCNEVLCSRCGARSTLPSADGSPAVCDICRRDGDASAMERWRAQRERVAKEKERRAAVADERLAASIGRIMERVGPNVGALSLVRGAGGRDAADSTAGRDAAAVRISWYIPERFRRCVLDLCPSPNKQGRCACEGVRHFVIYEASQRSAHRAAVDWAERCGTGEGLALALLGKVGTGKSHLLYAAIRRANERGVNAGAWGWFDLAETLRAASADSDRDLRQRAAFDRDRAKAAKAIGLDEIRATSGTGFDGTQLSNLMTRAYRNCQDVIVTSNHAGKELEDIIGLAASSRLTQVQIIGPDHRRPGELYPLTNARTA